MYITNVNIEHNPNMTRRDPRSPVSVYNYFVRVFIFIFSVSTNHKSHTISLSLQTFRGLFSVTLCLVIDLYVWVSGPWVSEPLGSGPVGHPLPDPTKRRGGAGGGVRRGRRRRSRRRRHFTGIGDVYPKVLKLVTRVV